MNPIMLPVTLTTAGASPYQVGLLGDNSGFAGKLSHNAIGGGSTACLLRFMTNTAGSAAAEWARQAHPTPEAS